MSRRVGTRRLPGYSTTRAYVSSPPRLTISFAIKGLAARPRDAEDIRQLTQVLGLHTVEDVLALVREIFPEEEPPPRLRLLLEDIFSDPEGGRGQHRTGA